MTGQTRQMPLYCENTPYWIAEPVNTATNIAFFIAAYALWQLYQRAPARTLEMRLMLLFLIGTGFGSAAWHATQERWGLIMDVLFIQVFILTYIIAYIYRYTRWPWWFGAPFVLGFVLVSSWIPSVWPFPISRGSSGYLAAWLVLGVMAWHQYRHYGEAGRWLAIAFGVFIVSLTLRTLDMPLCSVWPMGLHFMWHVLNAVVLYCVARGFWQSLPKACRAPKTVVNPAL